MIGVGRLPRFLERVSGSASGLCCGADAPQHSPEAEPETRSQKCGWATRQQAAIRAVERQFFRAVVRQSLLPAVTFMIWGRVGLSKGSFSLHLE